MNDNGEPTTDIAFVRLRPEAEPAQHGIHLGLSCHLTCPVSTSDPVPSICCR